MFIQELFTDKLKEQLEEAVKQLYVLKRQVRTVTKDITSEADLDLPEVAEAYWLSTRIEQCFELFDSEYSKDRIQGILLARELVSTSNPNNEFSNS